VGVPFPSAAAVPAVKKKSTESSQLPPWMKAVLGTFVIYVVVVVVLQLQELPSSGVQKNLPPEEHEHSNPAALSSITELEKQLAADPNNAELLLQFANMLHDAKFYPRAIEIYKKYLVQAPKNYDAQVDLGICYFETGELGRAVKEIEAVISANPKHQMAMFNLGVIQLSAQNMEEAQIWLKRCIELDPQSTAGLRAQQILQQHQ